MLTHFPQAVPVVLAERGIRQEHAALPLRDATDAALVVAQSKWNRSTLT